MSKVNEEFEVIVCGEGMGSEPRTMRLWAEATVHDAIKCAKRQKFFEFAVEEVSLFAEDGDDELELDLVLVEIGITHHHRVHIHRSKWIDVTVHYGAEERAHRFRPAATVRMVKQWALGQFTPTECDDPDTLKISGTDTTLSDDTHIGTLVAHEHSQLSLDLFTAECDIHYTVGDEAQVTRKRKMTAREIIEKAFEGTSENPANYYLKDITDLNNEISYQGQPDSVVCMRDGKRFLAIFDGPTPVSQEVI